MIVEGKKGPALDLKEIDRSTTVDRVVAVLRQAMFDGDLAPGQSLREIPLSQKLGVARSTTREALRALETDGLVVRMPNRALAVRHLTVTEVEDIFTARHFLEGAAAQAAGTCPEPALAALRSAFETYADTASRRDPSLAAMAHVEFHAVMVGLTGSRRLAETERSLMRDLQLVIASIDKSSDDLPQEVEKHRILTELFCRRQVAQALEYNAAYLDHAKAFVIRHAAGAGQAEPEAAR
jgi:DNA-binding GntR family transcriptional regulator